MASIGVIFKHMDIILLFIGAIFGGLISWSITHRYYRKSSNDQKQLIDKLSEQLKEMNTLKYFEVLLEKSKWKKEFIGNNKIWIAEENITFQIHCGDSGSYFQLPWTAVYPDKNAWRYPVYLKIGSAIIKEITFISMDGGRISVPLTEYDLVNDKIVFYWDMSSLSVSVCQIIGNYDIYKNLYGVAKMSKVEIRNRILGDTIM